MDCFDGWLLDPFTQFLMVLLAILRRVPIL